MISPCCIGADYLLICDAPVGRTSAMFGEPPGVLRYRPNDHFGYDDRARFLLSVQGGQWRNATK